jgi:hypothetical protein
MNAMLGICHAWREVSSAPFELTQQFDFSIITLPAVFGAPQIFEAVFTCQGIFSE